jgi:amino acid transporter
MVDAIQGTRQLHKNAIGLSHIVFFVVAAAAPLTAVVGATPAAFGMGNGPGVPGTFVLAGGLYLLFSVGFTAMSRFVGSAGAFYTYITQGLGKPIGVAGALIALLAYNAVQIAIYALFGVFVDGALSPFSIHLPWWAYSLLAVLAVTLCGQRNVAFSGNLLGVCMLAEIAILLLLDIAVLLNHGGPEGLSASTFAPQNVFAPGLGASLVFVVGSYIGFEATAIFSEEARDPAWTIPRATYIAVLLITGFYALSTWAIAQAYGPSVIAEAAKANPQTLYFVKSSELLGGWSTEVMNVLLITSLFACVLSFHNTINRYFFALGREGLVWQRLGTVHPRHGSPVFAGLVQSLIVVMVVALFAATEQDPYAVVFSWMSALAVLGILAVQVLVCLAVIAFFREDARGLSPWKRLIAPTLSAAGLTGTIGVVIANLPLLSGSDSLVVASFPYIIVLVGVVGVVFALWLKSSRPSRYGALGRVFEA